MKKKLIFFLMLFILTVSIINTAYGIEYEKYINVRVRSPRQENEYIRISGRDDIGIYKGNLEKNELFLETEKDNLTVKIDSYYNNEKYYNEYDSKVNYGPYHIIVEEKFKCYEEAVEYLYEIEKETNLRGFVYYDGSDFLPLIGRYISEKKAEKILSDKFDKYDASIENHKSQSIVIFDGENPIFSYNNNYNIFFKSGDGEKIYFDGVEYHGSSAFYIIDEYKLLSINLVSIEDYLKGVVPSEIPSSWHEESLKAQAVAARTYAVSNTRDNPLYGYHVVDNQNSQVYSGIERENSTTNKAVEETEGELIYYNDRLITAFYHSTSGGKTADSGNVWSTTLPYLISVEDKFSNISPYTEWVNEFSKEELIDILEEEFEVEDIYDMDLLEVSEDERVIEISLKTDKGEIIFIKEEIRAVLGYSELKSTWFKIDKNNKIDIIQEVSVYKSNLNELEIIKYDDEKLKKEIIGYNKNINIKSKEEEFKLNSSPSLFVIKGRGWGHGIGMSQYGAKQMAEEGFTYNEILEYYYTGVEVKWRKNLQKNTFTTIYLRN